MKEFIEFIAKSLVDHPESVIVDEKVDEENRVVFTLKVQPNEVGKLIGKQGKTAMAIRTLLTAVADKSGKKAAFEIDDRK